MMSPIVGSDKSRMLCFVFGSATFGGHEMMAARIVAELVAAGRRVRVLAHPRSLERIGEQCGTGPEFAALAHAERRFESIAGFLNPRVALATHEMRTKTAGCDTVVAVNGGVTANHALTLALALARRSGGYRLVMYYPMIHTSAELALSPLRALGYRAALGRVTRHMDGFLTIDQMWRDRLEALSSRPLRIDLVHNYVDRGRFNVRDAGDTPRGAGPLKVCLVGRLDRHQKGLDLFVEVVEHLANCPASHPVHFGIIGDGPYREELKRRCDELAGDAVRFVFHGWQANPVRLMESHDALILPSRLEGVPTVVVEALLAGLQVFAFDIPGLRQLLPETSLTPAFDTAALADRLRDRAESGVRERPGPGPYVEMLADRKRFASEVQHALGDGDKAAGGST